MKHILITIETITIGSVAGAVGGFILIGLILLFKKIGGKIEHKLDLKIANIAPKPCRSCSELVEVKSDVCPNCNTTKPAPFFYRELKTVVTYIMAIVILGPPLLMSLYALYTM